MTFELELGEIRVWCSSPACTQKLVEKGARLVNPAQLESLNRALEREEADPASASAVAPRAS